jgi:outer membrane protein TolC
MNRVREARAGLVQAERSKELMADVVRLEVKQSFLRRNEAVAALAIAEGGLAQAREAARVAREAFRNGIATNSAVLDAQASLTGAEMSRIAALAGLRLAEAELLLAAGVAGR